MKFLQTPDGMKRKVLKIADELGDVAVYCESCYGACDLAVNEAKSVGCDKIIHYGHSKMVECDLPVEYVEMREDYDPTKVLKKDIGKIKENRIGLVSTLQFVDSLVTAKRFLENNGKAAVLGKGKYNPGQILGCDISSAKHVDKDVDAFLFIGTGRFHPLGVAMHTEKPVYVLDVEREEISDLNEFKQKFLRQRYAAIAIAKDAKRIGILVSTKPGQMNMILANKMKERLESNDRKAYILVFNEIRPEKLEGLDLDAYINTACPRIAIEDRTNFKRPILNPDETESFI